MLNFFISILVLKAHSCAYFYTQNHLFINLSANVNKNSLSQVHLTNLVRSTPVRLSHFFSRYLYPYNTFNNHILIIMICFNVLINFNTVRHKELISRIHIFPLFFSVFVFVLFIHLNHQP